MGLHISPGTAPPRESVTWSSPEAGSSSSSGALMPRRLPQELPTFQRQSSLQNPPFLLGKVGGIVLPGSNDLLVVSVLLSLISLS